MVSIRDKAFGLLLIDHYLEKWTINAEEGAAGIGTMENNSTTIEAKQPQQQKKKQPVGRERKRNQKNPGKVHS